MEEVKKTPKSKYFAIYSSAYKRFQDVVREGNGRLVMRGLFKAFLEDSSVQRAVEARLNVISAKGERNLSDAPRAEVEAYQEFATTHYPNHPLVFITTALVEWYLTAEEARQKIAYVIGSIVTEPPEEVEGDETIPL